MKTTKKGFTLIELIVVIAIIGVLAAILVPAMLGWVKKSKIQAANADAKTIMTNINAGLEEIDEEGKKLDAGMAGWHDNSITGGAGGGATSTDIDKWSKVIEYVKDYSDSITASHYSVFVKDGVVICAVAKSGKYYGTYPAGLTNKNYNKALPAVDADMSASNKTMSDWGLSDTATLANAKTYALAVYNQGRDTKIAAGDNKSATKH